MLILFRLLKMPAGRCRVEWVNAPNTLTHGSAIKLTWSYYCFLLYFMYDRGLYFKTWIASGIRWKCVIWEGWVTDSGVKFKRCWILWCHAQHSFQSTVVVSKHTTVATFSCKTFCQARNSMGSESNSGHVVTHLTSSLHPTWSYCYIVTSWNVIRSRDEQPSIGLCQNMKLYSDPTLLSILFKRH